MRQKCVCCVARSAPPSQFVMSVRSTIVLNVLTPTLVGPMLFCKLPFVALSASTIFFYIARDYHRPHLSTPGLPTFQCKRGYRD